MIDVPPLLVDSSGSPGDSPAVALFCQRARAIDIRFRVDAAALDAIAEVCRTLDGLPLAIELAAARGRTLQPEQLLARLTSSAASDRPWASLARAPIDSALRPARASRRS